MSANKSPIASPAKGQNKDQKPSPPANSDDEVENRSMKSETVGHLSSSDVSDEFVDVVVLGPSGAEEQPAKERKQHKQTTTHQQSSSSSSSPSKQQQQQPTEAVPVQQQSPQQTQMDPPPQYQPTADSKQHTDPNQQHNQSWFSSSSLPSFLAATQAGSDEQNQNASQHSSASALRVLAELRARLQPWNLFFRPAKFGLPPGLVAIGPRVKYNLQHFLSNYLCLFIVLLIYCILTSLLMLLTLIVLAGLCYTIYQRTQKGPVLLGGQEIPPSLLYTLALMVCIPLFYLANAGSVMYWVIGTGLFLMLAHSVFYASEEVPGQEFEVVTVVTA